MNTCYKKHTYFNYFLYDGDGKSTVAQKYINERQTHFKLLHIINSDDKNLTTKKKVNALQNPSEYSIRTITLRKARASFWIANRF